MEYQIVKMKNINKLKIKTEKRDHDLEIKKEIIRKRKGNLKKRNIDQNLRVIRIAAVVEVERSK